MEALLYLVLIYTSVGASLGSSIKNNTIQSTYYNEGIPISIKLNTLLDVKLETPGTQVQDNFHHLASGVDNNKGGNTQQSIIGNNESSKSTNNCFDYRLLCKSLLGTSKLPECYGLDINKDDSKKQLPKSCRDVHIAGNKPSGIYEIQPRASNKSIMVLCDMETKGGGWTHIQKRYDGSQDFYLGWRDYKFGFGDLRKEFWLGLENIHLITGFEINELLVELTDADNKMAYAQYESFGVGAEKEGYPLNTLKGYKGDAGDDMLPHLGSKFSTKDFDQDTWDKHCAVEFVGAWWYKACHASNLNGQYWIGPGPAQYKAKGVHWLSFKGHLDSLAATRMLIRPVLS